MHSHFAASCLIFFVTTFVSIGAHRPWWAYNQPVTNPWPGCYEICNVTTTGPTGTISYSPTTTTEPPTPTPSTTKTTSSPTTPPGCLCPCPCTATTGPEIRYHQRFQHGLQQLKHHHNKEHHQDNQHNGHHEKSHGHHGHHDKSHDKTLY